MSSDLNKRISELEQQLHEAKENRNNLLDGMEGRSGDYYDNMGLDIAEGIETINTIKDHLVQLDETKQNLLKTLEEYKAAADTIDTLTEEVNAAADAAASKEGELEQVMMAINVLEEKLKDTENGLGLLQQEFALAQANEEYTGGLERKISELTESVQTLLDEVSEAGEQKYACERNTFQALKAKQQAELKLAEAINKSEQIIPIEHKLMELGEVIQEENDKLESYKLQVEELSGAVSDNTSAFLASSTEVQNIDIQIANIEEELSVARAQLEQLVAEESAFSEEILSLLDAVDQCTQYNEIYNLEESFNKVGMTLQKTTNNRTILCRVQDNKIVTENVIDDYIFVGPAKRLHEGVINKIKDFVLANEGVACTPTHEPITIMNEDKKFSLDFLVESERGL